MEKYTNFVKPWEYQEPIKYEWLNENKGGQFIRKGVVGEWVNHFRTEMADDWDKKKILEKLSTIGIKYDD